MAGSYTFPALGAALAIAVAGGIQLGQGAIAMINPIHFQGPAIHPRDRGAAIDEHQIRPREPSFASFYGWAEGNDARSLDCRDCEAVAARDSYASLDSDSYLEPVVIHRAVRQEWVDPVIVYADEQEVGGQDDLSQDKPESDPRVDRYVSYPVEADEVAETDASKDSE